ncbi:MAG TPA: RnfABCDGE type electron transport complex subunit G [Oscillospiraceae bacterium]|nr:RnfABCDGE type electron transport complex subunit G [Oscillospiraceae bacterium]
MKTSFVKEYILPALSLFSICLVCSVLLAFTNSATKEKIAERQKEAESKSISSAVRDAVSFSDALSINVDENEQIYYEAFSKDDVLSAYVFITTSKGYGGEVKVVTGIDSNGLCTGVVPIILNETPGLGMKAGAENFLNQYLGKSENIGVKKSGPTKNDIEAISGATITSDAVTDAVNTAFKVYNAVKEANNK